MESGPWIRLEIFSDRWPIMRCKNLRSVHGMLDHLKILKPRVSKISTDSSKIPMPIQWLPSLSDESILTIKNAGNDWIVVNSVWSSAKHPKKFGLSLRIVKIFVVVIGLFFCISFLMILRFLQAYSSFRLCLFDFDIFYSDYELTSKILSWINNFKLTFEILDVWSLSQWVILNTELFKSPSWILYHKKCGGV